MKQKKDSSGKLIRRGLAQQSQAQVVLKAGVRCLCREGTSKPQKIISVPVGKSLITAWIPL
jgi:hypothetical protein